jgi:hypothetical protein
MLHLDLLEVPLEFDKLHQLLTVVLGVEAQRLRLHQRRLTQVKVSRTPVKLDLLLPQHLIEVEGVLGADVVHFHLVEVLLSSSLSFSCLASRSALTLTRAISEILAFFSHARSCSCSSSSFATDTIMAEGGGGRLDTTHGDDQCPTNK